MRLKLLRKALALLALIQVRNNLEKDFYDFSGIEREGDRKSTFSRVRKREIESVREVEKG